MCVSSSTEVAREATLITSGTKVAGVAGVLLATNHPFPEGKKRLVLFRLYPDIHLLVKVFCHLCERETLSKNKKKKKKKKQNKTKKEGKEGSNKENGHSFFSSIAIARRTKAEGSRPKQ